LTMGLNYRPHANFVIRPEVRYDWVASDGAATAQTDDAGNPRFADADDYNNWSFGMDAIFTF
ncbi:MAG: outer membrane beta-barrel protein, partial [Planctomycetota bacterium]